jgi:ATP-dependent phosphoenolpyruvate carboxykinase
LRVFHPPLQSRIKVRVITERAYHALFMSNMLIRPTPAELDDFGEPEFVIYNAGETGGLCWTVAAGGSREVNNVHTG